MAKRSLTTMGRTAKDLSITAPRISCRSIFIPGTRYTDSSADPYDAIRLAKQIREILDTSWFSESGKHSLRVESDPRLYRREKARLQGMENAAYIGAVLSYLQDAPVDHAHFYRGDAAWMGLFDLQGHVL
jgi:hypothetical protein